MGDNGAILQGYSRSVVAISDRHELYLLVKPETDFDCIFKAWDTDAQEFIRISGWLYSVEDK